MGFKEIKLPSNKRFGLFMSLVLSIMGLFFFFSEGHLSSLFFILASIIIFLISITSPRILQPLNTGWMKLGFLLGRIISPIVFSSIFFVLITPTALLMRLISRDELQLKKIDRTTYWRKRSPPGPDSSSFKNQF